MKSIQSRFIIYAILACAYWNEPRRWFMSGLFQTEYSTRENATAAAKKIPEGIPFIIKYVRL